MENILEIKNLTKTYKEFKLKNISLTIPKGTIMGFVGENGAGKTTTMRSILQLTRIDQGSIEIFGKDIVKFEKEVKSDLGVVLDEVGFPVYLKVKDLDNIMKNIHKKWDSTLFNQYLKKFELPLTRKIKDLSKGMKMKLMIIIAMSHHAQFLILDEPTSGLDPMVRDEILEMFMEFIQDEQKAILFSSHITSDIERVCDYITFIHRGEIQFSEEKDHLLEDKGIIKGDETMLHNLEQHYVLGVRKHSFGCDILVNNKDKIKMQFPNIVIDSASLEDIMLFMSRGEKL